MGIISQEAMLVSLLIIVTTSTSIPTINAQLHLISHSLPLPHLSVVHPPSPSPSPSPAPAPSPSHHHHHHHHSPSPAPAPSPSHHHHHHHHSPSPAPVPSHHHHHHTVSPSLSNASSSPPRQPSKPVIPSPPPTAKTPASPPVQPPTTKPANPPVPAPTTPTGKRKFVAVQGMVYCKNCTFSGVNTLLGASPLPGARVVIRCRNTQYIIRKTTTTDQNGYFFLEAPRLVTTYGAHKCKVYLAHRPNNGPCSNVTDLNNGASGAFLFSNNTGPPMPLPTFSLFSVGPFAYESPKC